MELNNENTLNGGGSAGNSSNTGPIPTPPTPSEVPTPTPQGLSPEAMKMITDLQDQVKVLTEAADKGRIDHIQNKKKKKISPIVRVSFYNDKLVVAWRMALDEVYRDGEGVWHETQIVEITLDDESKEKLSYIDFHRLLKKKDAEIVERKAAEDPNTPDGVSAVIETFKVKILETGKVVTLDGSFIN